MTKHQSKSKKSHRNQIKCGSLAVRRRPSSAHSERGGVSQGRKTKVPRDKVLPTHNSGAAIGGGGREGFSLYLIGPLHVSCLNERHANIKAVGSNSETPDDH